VRAALFALLLCSPDAGPDAGPGAPDGSVAPPAASTVLEDAAAADLRLRVDGTCAEEDLAVYRRAVAWADGLGPAGKPGRWAFPIRGFGADAIGGTKGEGYLARFPRQCFARTEPGHPAHDIFVPDPDQDCRDEKGRPFHAVAVEDGVVLVAHLGWKPGDTGKGGNYVVLYLPSRRKVAYYAHLESIAVKAGDRVKRGETLGVIGRTGWNAYPKRSPTHLHFALWDAKSFAPDNPYGLLSQGERQERNAR
jgi:hypothetical protein